MISRILPILSFTLFLSLAFPATSAHGQEPTVTGPDNPVEEPIEVTGKVSVDRLNVRARPGTSYEVVAKVVRDQELTVVGREGEWLEIIPPPRTAAWCSTRYVGVGGRISGDKVRVRSGPGVVFSVYAILPAGAVVETVGEAAGDWQQIVVPKDATVWVHGQFVDIVEAPAESLEAVTGVGDETGPDTADASASAETAEVAGEGIIPKLNVQNISRIDAGETTVAEALAPVPEGGPDSAGSPVVAGGQLPLGEGGDGGADGNEGVPEAVMIDDSFIETAEEGAPPVPEGPQVEQREGTLVSLKTKANEFATHALVARDGDKAYLLCYVISDLLNLGEWENHSVRIFGRPVDYEGWRTDVLHATGIQLLAP